MSEKNEKWKQTSNELQQTKEDINVRVNNLEEANQVQIATMQQKTEERCIGIETTVNTIQSRVNNKL